MKFTLLRWLIHHRLHQPHYIYLQNLWIGFKSGDIIDIDIQSRPLRRIYVGMSIGVLNVGYNEVYSSYPLDNIDFLVWKYKGRNYSYYSTDWREEEYEERLL